MLQNQVDPSNFIKYYIEFKQYYQRKKKEGKHSMSIINAVRNKLVLRVVATVINNQQPYVDHTAAIMQNRLWL